MRRRLIVLALVVALGTGVAFGVRALIGVIGDSTADDATTAAPTTAAPDPSADPTEVTTEQLANPVACEPDAVRLQVAQPSGGLRGGDEARVPVTVRNTGDLPCLVDVGPAGLALALDSGEDRVWSSRDCSDPESSRRLLLDTGSEETATVRWPGTRSAQGCPGDQPDADGGTYRLTATLEIGTGISDTATIEVR